MALPAERTSDPEKPVKDYGSISHWSTPMTDDAMQGMTYYLERILVDCLLGYV